MASPRRIEQLNIVLKEELSKILDREVEFPEGTLVTITRAIISEDVRYATIFVSTLGNAPLVTTEILKKNIYRIQHMLNRALRIRPVPKIRFVTDEGEARRETVEKSIAELKRDGSF